MLGQLVLPFPVVPPFMPPTPQTDFGAPTSGVFGRRYRRNLSTRAVTASLHATWGGNRLSATSHSQSGNTKPTRRVSREASRNGKVIFPSWLGPMSGMPRSIWAAWYAFLGGAQVDIGPPRRCRPEARSFGLLFFPLSAFCKGCHGQEKGCRMRGSKAELWPRRFGNASRQLLRVYDPSRTELFLHFGKMKWLRPLDQTQRRHASSFTWLPS
jgi:hypothetical protein